MNSVCSVQRTLCGRSRRTLPVNCQRPIKFSFSRREGERSQSKHIPSIFMLMGLGRWVALGAPFVLSIQHPTIPSSQGGIPEFASEFHCLIAFLLRCQTGGILLFPCWSL
ncbi:hypothetical protein CDAR_489901 [Caerostris darwini]|uniref:Uncharacterized protein n=1 Tax=Caerostris darwini TaxID=1538125 RepID=A0AAV4S6M9_9ARAC|nr:hypothetical protein CDAR_489901 [Caerostris darwini]